MKPLIDKSTPRVYTARPITLARSIGFGVLDLMGGGWNTIISGLMLYFFTTYGDVSAVQAGTILFIARIVDAVVSLIIGPLTDNFYRTRLGKKFGRRHFFLLIGAPLLLVVFPLLWISQQGFWYYLIVYLAVEMIMAMILIPWETLPTEMTDNYKLRTKLSSTRMFLSATGTFLVFFIPAQIKATNSPNAYLITGLIFSVLFAGAVITTYFTTWERKLTPEFLAELDAQPKVPVGKLITDNLKDFGSTFKNSSFRKHLAIYLFSFTGKDIFATALTFFVVYAVHGSESFGLTLQALSIIGLPATVLAAFLMIRKGPRYLFAMSYSVIIACLLALGAIYLIQPSSTMVLLVIVGLAYQAGRALLEFTPWNVFPFIPDVDRIMTRQDRAGIYAAVMTFGRKSTGAVATLLVSWFLDLGGFLKPGSAGGVQLDASCTTSCPLVQSTGTQHVIALVVILGPLVLIAIAFAISRFMYLDPQSHAVLRTEIDRLEAGGSKDDVTSEARVVVEKLTGHPYESAWPEDAISPTVTPVSNGS
ncbi:MFS transporter [Cryobacterium zhongshanensis]|uniref:MFS transporter n=1 Tax=Cryobacterium zhongshanensis TaxID=2928153 RepID=A0AA41QX52_9MICO|nr:MFS transporter [Cryobacterium zhongshanensis]MCI4658917.1 MFS transporter [Cryobacterium zhongshanensis]